MSRKGPTSGLSEFESRMAKSRQQTASYIVCDAKDARLRPVQGSLDSGRRSLVLGGDGRPSTAPRAGFLSNLLIPVLFRHQHGVRQVYAGVAWTCCLFFGSFPM